jgi:transcriptional regulator with XRE-family HTH domain
MVDALAIFAHNLRSAREERGLTQERLAELADLHMTDVGRIERGERDPGIRTAAKLARGLGVSLAELLDGIQP